MVRDLDFPVDVVSVPDRARARRAGHEQPQHLPHRVRPRGRRCACRRALRAGAEAAAEGPSAIRRAAAGRARARSRWPWSTTSCSCTRHPRGRARVVPRRGAARRRRPGRHDPADRQHPAPRRPRRRRARGLLRRARRQPRPSRSAMERNGSSPFATPGERAQRHDLRLPARWPRPVRAGPPPPTSSSSGSGIAGLTARCGCASGSTGCCSSPRRCSPTGSTQWAQGGIAAALDPADSPAGAPARHPRRRASGSATWRRCAPWSPRAPPGCASWSALGAEFDRRRRGRDQADPRGRPPPRPHRPRRRRRHRAEISRALIAALHAVQRRPGHRGHRARPRRRPAPGRRAAGSAA